MQATFIIGVHLNLSSIKPFNWEDLHGRDVTIYRACDDYHENKIYIFGIDKETTKAYLLFEENFSSEESIITPEEEQKNNAYIKNLREELERR